MVLNISVCRKTNSLATSCKTSLLQKLDVTGKKKRKKKEKNVNWICKGFSTGHDETIKTDSWRRTLCNYIWRVNGRSREHRSADIATFTIHFRSIVLRLLLKILRTVEPSFPPRAQNSLHSGLRSAATLRIHRPRLTVIVVPASLSHCY